MRNLLLFECLGKNQRLYEFADAVLLGFGVGQYLFGEIFVGEAEGAAEGELSVESIAALPESADSALAAVVNFLVIMRPLTGRANWGLFFVAGNCGGFQAVKVAQNASEMKLKNPKSQYLLGFFGRARGGIGRRAGFRFRCLRA